eukprot:1878228-Alexandrium_andersonii.AAC.1
MAGCSARERGYAVVRTTDWFLPRSELHSYELRGRTSGGSGSAITPGGESTPSSSGCTTSELRVVYFR